MQCFASFEPLEIFEEFNGVPGAYIKSFLISDKINLNDWQATHEANISNLQDALGRLGIHYINPVDGKRVLLELEENDVVDLRVKTALAGSNDFTVQSVNFVIKK